MERETCLETIHFQEKIKLCDSKTGYLWNFSTYTGKSPTNEQPESELSSLARIVMKLMTDLLNKGYCVVTDNFSRVLYCFVLCLPTRQMHWNVRLGRKGMPPYLMKAKLKKGECIFRCSGRLLALSWHDKRTVSMLSTIHDVSIIGTGKIDRESGQEKMKSNVIVQYNAFMGGVDKLDQMLEPYLSLCTTMKWYKKPFQHLLDVTVYNSFVLTCICTSS